MLAIWSLLSAGPAVRAPNVLSGHGKALNNEDTLKRMFRLAAGTFSGKPQRFLVTRDASIGGK